MRTLILAALLLAGCAPRATPAPQDAFFDRLSALCGKAFAGTVETNDPADAGFTGKALIMHVRSCSPTELRIPFHVGGDRSRTWVITRQPAGLRLKHDHRRRDGREDAVTQYGGDTVAGGTALRQQFPVDGESKAMFVREGRAVSLTNVWAIEIDPGTAFVYELARPGRLFRVRFDLSRSVGVPPPPWGG